MRAVQEIIYSRVNNKPYSDASLKRQKTAVYSADGVPVQHDHDDDQLSDWPSERNVHARIHAVCYAKTKETFLGEP